MTRHKFNARITERDGFKFHSKAEAKFYDELKLRQQAGEVLFFLMQVPFHIPPGVKYVCDFQVFYTDGEVEFIDVKGQLLQSFIDKKKMVEHLYPIDIKIVKA